MDGLTPIALRAREKALLEKMEKYPPHFRAAYFHAKNGQSLSELKSTIEAFEEICKDSYRYRQQYNEYKAIKRKLIDQEAIGRRRPINPE